MASPNLPVNIDTSYADSETDASVKAHQQHHDKLHAWANKQDVDAVPATGQALTWNGSLWAPATVGSTGYPTVKDYGAKGDNATDDSVAIQAALNASRYVVFPPGIYRAKNLVTQPGTYIVGLAGRSAHEGLSTTTVAYISPTANSDIIFNLGGQTGAPIQQGTIFERINFIGNGFTGATGIRARNYNRLGAIFCTFRDLNVGMELEPYGNDSAWHDFFGLTFYDCGKGLLSADSVGFTSIGGNTIQGTGQIAFDVGANNSQHVRIIGHKFDGGTGIRSGGGSSEFNDCTFEACDLGIDLYHGATEVSIVGRGHLISGCIFNGAHNPAMKGIRVGARCTNTVIIAPMYVSCSTNLEDYGTNTQTILPR